MNPDAVRAYHQRTKHHLDRYAAGPGTLDWDAQPDSFRTWSDTARIALPRDIDLPAISWSELDAARAPAPLTLASLATLLRLCVALSAWKQYGDARWSLRVHPSSGNLHPTETYVLAVGVSGLADGLYHYQPRDHSLELRGSQPDVLNRHSRESGSPGHTLDSRFRGNDESEAGLWLGFSSIHWREAWKYGERAFRYCQLDQGHVLAAVSYAAALLGWQPRLARMAHADLAHLLGVDRGADFTGVEPEEAEALIAVQGDGSPPGCCAWHGRPSLLDPRPLYDWPVIKEVAVASRGVLPDVPATAQAPMLAAPATIDEPAASILLKRRSAQAFDGVSVMPRAVFDDLLAAMLPGGSPAWRLWPHAARVHAVLLVHRVADLAPGVYCLPRSQTGETDLRAAMRDSFEWSPADLAMPLRRLVAAQPGKVARTLSCHQDIASHGAFAVMFVAEFNAALADNPAAYRHLHWEAGLCGHALTLAAEAAGWRGTGIGCFFDDAGHEVLGLADTRYQIVYHFAVGMPLDDARLLTLPAYE